MSNEKFHAIAIGCLIIGAGAFMLSVSACILYLTFGG